MPRLLNVFIVGYYGFENAGDEAILHAIITELKALRPEIRFTAASFNPAGTSERHGIQAISWRDNLAMFDAIADADLTILGGGGLFHDYWGLNPNLFLTHLQSGVGFFTAPAILAALLEKPLMLYAVGVGPLFSGPAKRFTRVACEAASAITVRDKASKLLLESIGVAGERISVTADPVFGLFVEDPVAIQAVMPVDSETRRPLIAVSVRDWQVGVQKDFWEPELARALDQFLADQGGTILFVALGRLAGEKENDEVVSERIRSQMRYRDNSIVVSRDLPTSELLNLFGLCDLTVAMRLHALIFSALKRVPFVALSYDPKIDGLIEQIGSPDVIDVKSLEANTLVRAMSEALARTGEFRTDIPQKLRVLAGMARQNAHIALATLQQNQRPSGHSPSPEVLSLLVGGLRANFLARQTLLTDDKQLRADYETLDRLQQSQNEIITRLTEDRDALQEELGKARQFQQAQDESLAGIEADRSAPGEELNTLRRLRAASEQLHAQHEAERSALSGRLERSLENTIRLERERDSIAGQLRTERNAREVAERERAAALASLRISDLARRITAGAIQEHRQSFERESRFLRSDQALKLLLYLLEKDLRFPDIERSLPDGVTAPVVCATPGPESFGPPQGNRYDVIILGIIDFDFRFQRPQQIAAQFARLGHRVFWISPARFLAPSAEQPYESVPLRENIREIHLRAPQPDVYLGRLEASAARTLAASLESLFRDQAIAESLLMLQLPFWRQVGLHVREKFGSILSYDCMDDWESFENMGAFNVLEEKSLATECDVLVVTGKELEDKFKARGIDSLLARNGADFEFFRGAQSARLLAGIPRPVVGYFGAIADWIDLDLVRAVAALRPHYSFVLIGQVFGRDMSALEALPNVYLLGNQQYQRIPSFLADFDACTIPFLLNQVTRATDPVKIYEYLSQGKPVIATDMPELARCGDLIYIGKDPEDFARKVDAALGEADNTNNALQQRRIEFARNNTWARRVEAIDTRVRKSFPLVSILIVTYNSAEFVRLCLDSIRDCTAYPALEIIVVDNGSTDGTADILRKYALTERRIRVECLDRNSGFAAGNNLAARQANGEYLILLNIDTMVTSGWVERLLRHVRLDPSIGIICPVTNFAGNEIKINIDYSDTLEMQHFALKVAREQQGRSLDVDVVPLYCALIPRRIWTEVGELDEEFGIGMFEDDDFSLRIRQAGYRVTAAEDCFIHHFGQGSFSKMATEEYQAIFETNRKRFEDKWKTNWKPHLTRPGVRPAYEEKGFAPAEFCAATR